MMQHIMVIDSTEKRGNIRRWKYYYGWKTVTRSTCRHQNEEAGERGVERTRPPNQQCQVVQDVEHCQAPIG